LLIMLLSSRTETSLSLALLWRTSVFSKAYEVSASIFYILITAPLFPPNSMMTPSLSILLALPHGRHLSNIVLAFSRVRPQYPIHSP
jgi:hypothetical protein